MAITIIYEPDKNIGGWFEDSGLTMASWFDRDLYGTVIPLVTIFPGFVRNVSTIFVPKPLTVEILPALFVNQNIFFKPVSVRALGAPDQMLKNEVRRVR
jgi:hypothetical protein